MAKERKEYSRRDLLFGGLRRAAQIQQSVSQVLTFRLRPPGASQGKAWLKSCPADCQACLPACPEGVIAKERAPDGSPDPGVWIDLRRGACVHCPDYPCIAACPHQALSNPDRRMGTASFQATCVTKQNLLCDMCRNSCPNGIQAIVKDGPFQLKIDSSLCVGCGLCVKACYLLPPAVEVGPLPKVPNAGV